MLCIRCLTVAVQYGEDEMEDYRDAGRTASSRVRHALWQGTPTLTPLDASRADTPHCSEARRFQPGSEKRYFTTRATSGFSVPALDSANHWRFDKKFAVSVLPPILFLCLSNTNISIK